MIRIENLSLCYGKRTILDDISLAVEKGECVGLLGANGAGKSTLLRCLARLATSDSGSIEVDGKAIDTYPRRAYARHVAYVPQHIPDDVALSVVDLVQLGRTPHLNGALGARDRDMVIAALERVNMAHHAFSEVSNLSGGERQRVAIARALVQEPQLLLLDEPTSALDLKYQMETMALIRTLATETDMTIIIAVHDLSLAARYCSRLVLLAEGRIRARGDWQHVLTADHIYHAYQVEALVGEVQSYPYVLPIESGDVR
ncbi:iron complex transport system ATP-binding protein [Cohaesibacter sp. ES.047]|uniref:ABC transporter ATP-binding protein n=1 Tax=Cohaesibacter sp. ES.047 TaxID=1798205 RepID=UPI000BB6EB94|nr:ABC transporter ATP-binding protein [Cohaesibacter sp. ES.047]SNY93161.1 iron complex transport system ATP-binding protein [Cohaesibacter sp. ES.047]